VNKDGDVIWSTTQESLGGRFRGASADVADKITRQLLATTSAPGSWRRNLNRDHRSVLRTPAVESRLGAGADAGRRPFPNPLVNRTCGFPASGFPTGFIAGSRSGDA